MEALSLPVIIALVFLAFRFNKAFKSIAEVVDSKVQITAQTLKADNIKDLNEIEISDQDIEDAVAKLELLKKIKI